MLALQVVMLLCAACAVQGLSSGAPQGSCADMVPKHKVEAQKGPSPYVVRTRPVPNSAGDYFVSIKGAGNFPTFKGFFVQCRNPNNQIIGKFVRLPSTAKAVDCNGSDTAATHSSAAEKSDITLRWSAPQGYTGDFNCLATVAQNGGVFWVAVPATKDSNRG